MYRKLLLSLFITCSIHAIAQTDYYYYKGSKIPLTLNESKVVVSVPKDCEKVCERIVASVQTLHTMGDDTFDCFIITRQDFEKLTSQDSWEVDVKSVILTSSYYTEGNAEVFATPYLTVKLKKEEDTDLLTSYAEKYSLVISKQVPLMSSWYILHITPGSKKNTLECANELWESGDFASSVPDFATNDILHEQTDIRNFTTATPKKSSEIYDLHGRHLAGKLQKGVYILDGRKYVR